MAKNLSRLETNGNNAISSSRKRVALLVESSRGFGQSLVKGIIWYSKYHARWIFYRETAGITEQRSNALKWPSDGIIAHVTDSKAAERMIPKGIPAVVKGIKELIPNVCNIVGATDPIAQMAAEHLLSCGFEHFAFCGFKEVLWSNEFCKFFSQRLQKEGFEVRSYVQTQSIIKQSWQKELENLAAWIRSLPKPVGIMASNDDRGQHLIEACKLTDFRIPEDVGIIGVDNDEWICNLTDPPMTSISLNTEVAGYETAELLDRLMSGEPMQGQIISIKPLGVITRQSTDVLFINDSEVLKAMDFIKQNFEEPIQVDDIVEATCISRRELYYRFKRTVNRSIIEELRRVRVEHIAKMIIETNLPISRIVDKCKYTNFRNISRYFKQEKGMSLLQYRRKFSKVL